MPIKFSDLARGTKSATLVLPDGEEIAFKFRYGLITQRFMQDLLALDESRLRASSATQVDEAVGKVATQMARVIAEWDVLDADGVTMFPLDAERLADEIPYLVQVQMLFACIQEMQPGEATAPESKAASSLATSKPSGATS